MRQADYSVAIMDIDAADMTPVHAQLIGYRADDLAGCDAVIMTDRETVGLSPGIAATLAGVTLMRCRVAA